jgi:hypothetical protein
MLGDWHTAIGEIQRRTGIDFLPGLTGTKRAEIENWRISKPLGCGQRNETI